MADERKPAEGETRKAWLHRVYGIGKGAGRGRISAEGHEKLAWAASKGYTFADTEVVAAPKKAAPKVAKVSVPKVTIPTERKAEASNVDPAAVREWAKGVGIHIGPRGRIAAEITMRYLNEVPEHERGEREAHGKDVRQAAPRLHPVGTVWRADLINHRGEKETVTLSDRTACGNCRYSLAWCGCAKPHVTVGYEQAGSIRLTAVYPKGVDA